MMKAAIAAALSVDTATGPAKWKNAIFSAGKEKKTVSITEYPACNNGKFAPRASG